MKSQNTRKVYIRAKGSHSVLKTLTMKRILPSDTNDKEEYKRQDLFEFMRLTMCVAAMYPWVPQGKVKNVLLRYPLKFLDVCYELFNLFVCAHIAGLYICTVYINFDEGDLEFLVNCLLQTTIYIWAICMKLYFRRIRYNLLDETIDFINKNYQTRSAAGFTYVTMEGSIRYSNIWAKGLIYSCQIAALFWLALPIAARDKSLPLACWYPFDYKVSFNKDNPAHPL